MNKFNQLTSILNRNIICSDDITDEKTQELIELCSQNGIKIKLENLETANAYTFSWTGWLAENKGFVGSVYDCQLVPFSDDNYYVSWKIFRSMAEGSYFLKNKNQYEKIIKGRKKKRDKRNSERMLAHWDWLSRQPNVNCSCIM